MVQRVETVLIDDLDGSKADTTVRFGLDGTEYEIDLSAGHASEFRRAAEKYTDAARKVSGSERRTARGGATRRTVADGPNPSEVREWAKSQGIDVKDRGRVPSELVVKFQAASDA